MNSNVKFFLKKILHPLYLLYRKHWEKYGKKHPMERADEMYYKCMGKHIDWDSPKDLNEKINWLKFHADQHEWAKLSDKYLVRDYITEKGLKDILIPLYGMWNDVDSLFADWAELPNEFVLKSNNGSGNVFIVNDKNGGKNSVDKSKLRRKLKKWLAEKDFHLDEAELHYQYIKNVIIAEELLKDNDIESFSQSMIDYKFWCFNGKPYGVLVVYDRELGTSHHYLDFYDLNWNEKTSFMSDTILRHRIEKPKNFEKMIEISRILSEGFPQVRIDLYNLNGKIYFGEMTFTSLGGYMDYFNQITLLEMGNQIKLDLSAPGNEFYYEYKEGK